MYDRFELLKELEEWNKELNHLMKAGEIEEVAGVQERINKIVLSLAESEPDIDDEFEL